MIVTMYKELKRGWSIPPTQQKHRTEINKEVNP